MNKRITTLAALTGTVTITLHVLNKLIYSAASAKNILPKDNVYHYEWRFGKIIYKKTGSGTPLLLIHDLTAGSSSYEFNQLIDELSKTHEVYTIDLLGYGQSDKVNMTYTNYVYVQLIIDFIKNVIGRKTDILAVGESAPISVMVSHNDPEVINKIILINPQDISKLNQIPSRQTRLFKFLIEIPVLGTFIFNTLNTEESIRQTFLKDYLGNPSSLKEDDVASYYEASHTYDYNSKYSFASYVGKYMNTNIIHALKEIDCCIYILYGDKKEDIKSIVSTYTFYNSSIETAAISGCKHLPHLEHAADVIANIELFLN